MKSINGLLLFFSILFLPVTSCKKQLDAKPNSIVLVPTTPTQLQGLLDNPDVFGYGHTLGLISADEFYFTPTYYSNLPQTMKNLYIWYSHPFDSSEIHYDWKRFYEQTFYANVVLEGVQTRISGLGGDIDLNRIKGDALFKRALVFFHLLQLFAPAYDKASAPFDLGIPLKLKSDVDEAITRSDVQKGYDKIVSDLNEARDLLQFRPNPLHRNRASMVAAQALLARVHLCMGNWQEAATEAGAVLQRYDSLINYNTVNKSADVPFPADNREVIYPLKAPDGNDENHLVFGLQIGGANVDSNFIRSYNANDLRLGLYYNSRRLKPTYTGTYTAFEGIGVSEIYLILAETNARMGRQDSALLYLEKLLENRYVTGTNLNLPDANQPDLVLDRILSERKKELAFRGQRWSDIKRLNKLDSNIIQQRIIAGQILSIGANDVRYALPLPETTVKKYTLEQNPR